MPKTAPRFNVEMFLRASVYVPVAASNLGEAFEAAKKLKLGDVAKFPGNEILDFNLDIAGVADPVVHSKLYD